MKHTRHEKPLVDRVEAALKKDPDLEIWQLAQRFSVSKSAVTTAKRKLNERAKSKSDSHTRFKEQLRNLGAS